MSKGSQLKRRERRKERRREDALDWRNIYNFPDPTPYKAVERIRKIERNLARAKILRGE
jgi:hypothetical protein